MTYLLVINQNTHLKRKFHFLWRFPLNIISTFIPHIALCRKISDQFGQIEVNSGNIKWQVFMLFSGKSVRELILKENGTEYNSSLDMMKLINALNRPVFEQDKFDVRYLAIKCQEQTIFERMFARFGLSSMDSVNAFNLVCEIRRRNLCPEEKAALLWKYYFKELPDYDFREGEGDRWLKGSIIESDSIIFSPRLISAREAVLKVFNRNMFSVPSWNKPFLRAFQQWLTDFPSEHPEIILESVILNGIIPIEIIRYHCETGSEFFSGGRKYQVIGKNHDFQTMNRAEVIVQAAETLKRANTSDNALSEFEIGKRSRTKFSMEESIDILRGLNHYCGEKKWSAILRLPGLAFHPSRSSTSLKDRHRILEQREDFIVLLENGRNYQ